MLFPQMLKIIPFTRLLNQVEVPVAYRTRQCDMLSVPESTSFTWRLSVNTAPEKPRFIIVGFQTAKMVIKLKIHPPSIM